MPSTLTSQSEPSRTTATKTAVSEFGGAIKVRTYDTQLEQRVIRRIDELRTYQDNWDGEGAAAPNARILDAMACCVRRSFGGFTPEPYVTPMSDGNVQFEWHAGRRTLELEFEGPETVHYLRWDLDANVRDEGLIAFHDDRELEGLMRWFTGKSLG